MVVFVVPMLLLLYCIEYSHTLTTIRACMHRSYDEGTSQPFFFFGLAGLNINIHRRVNSIWCENNALRGKRVTWHGGGVSTTTAQSGWEWNVKNVDTFLPFTEYNKLNFLSPSYNYMLYYFGHCWFYMHVRCACVCDASLAAISHHRGKAYLLTTNSLFFYFCIIFFLCNIVWVEWMDRMVVVDVVTVVYMVDGRMVYGQLASGPQRNYIIPHSHLLRATFEPIHTTAQFTRAYIDQKVLRARHILIIFCSVCHHHHPLTGLARAGRCWCFSPLFFFFIFLFRCIPP